MKSIIKKISYWFFLVLLSLHSSDVYSIHVIKKPSTSGGLSGTVASQAVAFGCGTNILCGDAAFTFDSTTKWLKIGSSLGTIDAPLHVRTNGSEGLRLQTGTTFPIYLRGKNAIVDDIGRIQFSSTTKNGSTRGGAIFFFSKPADGNQSSSAVSKVQIDPDGWVGIGTGTNVWDTLSIKSSSSGFLTSAKNFATAQIATTNATTTDLYTKTLTDGYVYNMFVTITARRSDGGAVENGTFARQFKVYRDGGGATLGTIVTPWADDQLTMAGTITVDTSGNDLRVRVTGEAGKGIVWFADIVYNTVFSQF